MFKPRSKFLGSLFFLHCFFISSSLLGRVDVLFHPYDATLVKIGDTLKQAKERIDIAMYNLEDSTRSPVIRALLEEEIQEKIADGSLEIRLIFEGYRGKEAATQTSSTLESYGIDVRWLKSGRKVHHKFAVIDSHLEHPHIISGSANWSLSSRRSYNENIFFIEGEKNLAKFFQAEFDLLWSASEEFGSVLSEDIPILARPGDYTRDGLSVVFNSDNFKFQGTRVSIDIDAEGFVLTRSLVKAIDKAKSSIQIATTRIKLFPLYNAILRAANRGVKIDIIVNMESYNYKRTRSRFRLPNCEKEYEKKCSSSYNFAHFLNKAQHPNIKLRLKYYNLFSTRDLSKQMHSKYLIADGRWVYSGSFNWSYSAEYSHIENLVKVDGRKHQLALDKFEKDFNRLFHQGRDQYQPFLQQLESALENEGRISCQLKPMALSFDEIDYMLNAGKRFNKKLKDACFD